MSTGYEMAQKQIQKLIMTPEFRQAIAVLQLPSVELREYVENEVLNNPLLELNDLEEGLKDDGEVVGGIERLSSVKDGPAGDVVPPGDGLMPPSDADPSDWQEYLDDRSDLGFVILPRIGEPDEGVGEKAAGLVASLQEHLSFQLCLNCSSPRDLAIGEVVIGCIDDDGYLKGEIDEIAEVSGVPPHEVARVLKLIQSFEPAGIGAKDLQECLLLQLECLDLSRAEYALGRAIIKDHLSDVADGKIQDIIRKTRASKEEVKRVIKLIRTLDPKPGRKFGVPADAEYIVPDVTIEKAGKEYIVIMNDVAVPRLTVNPLYRRMLRAGANVDEGTREFIKNKLSSAVGLIKSIEQRRLTLYKVTEAIVKLQREFFDKGVNHLKPLTLRNIAEAIGLHESTVSRAISGKYVQTPRGAFEFRFFFSSGVGTMQGEGASAESVKKMMGEIIKAEAPQRPFKDQELVRILQDRGIIISRRTVTKYRDEMRIPASGKRKRC